MCPSKTLRLPDFSTESVVNFPKVKVLNLRNELVEIKFRRIRCLAPISPISVERMFSRNEDMFVFRARLPVSQCTSCSTTCSLSRLPRKLHGDGVQAT